MLSTMKHGFAMFILLATTFLVAKSTPMSVGRAADLRSSLTSGPGACPVPEVDDMPEDEDIPEDDMDFFEDSDVVGIEEFLKNRRQQNRRKGCYWNGTAPFCAGKCKPGDELIKRDKRGGGSYCWIGTKVYCCPPLPDQEPKSPAGGTSTSTTSSTPTRTSSITHTSTVITTTTATTSTLAKTSTFSATSSATSSATTIAGGKITTVPSAPTPGAQVPLPFSQPPRIPPLRPVPKRPKRPTPPRGPRTGRPPPGVGPPSSPSMGGEPGPSQRRPPTEFGPGIAPSGESPEGEGQASSTGDYAPQELDEDYEDDDYYTEIAKNILSGLKDITKLNFMGQFGEFAELGDYKNADENERNEGREMPEKV